MQNYILVQRGKCCDLCSRNSHSYRRVSHYDSSHSNIMEGKIIGVAKNFVRVFSIKMLQKNPNKFLANPINATGT